ncbi:MAG: T9SS type A sorting domain-containing protein, partial [Candidatus Cloacimonetes bacterium]|nr:T9SS type A sorting domain-containing protein [Candidatus Cloacimonadota bacterium]
WVVGTNGKIYHTSDGGVNWNSQNTGTDNYISDVYFIDSNIGWAVGEYGLILNTTDGGDNWIAQTSGTTFSIKDVFFIDNYNGWAVGVMGLILHTVDGGNNWQIQTYGTYTNLNGVYFTDSNKGWVVGDVGTILHTTNSGEIWYYSDLGIFKYLHSIFFTDENTGWIVGSHGTIFHNTISGMSIDDNNFSELNKNLILDQNFPNPFNYQTIIQYTLPKSSKVTLKVYNLLGQEIQTLVDGYQTSGQHQIIWDAREKSCNCISNGIYFYNIIVENNNLLLSETNKMILLK